MKKRVLMVACVPVMIKHFNMPNIRMLQDMGYRVEVAFNCYEDEMWSKGDWEEFKKQLDREKILVHQIDFTRNAAGFAKHIKAYQELKAILKKRNYEFIHCHTPIAAAIARIAAHRTKTPILYTAHGFHFYKGAPLKNWLLYYPVEKLLSWWTDCLITINKEDYRRAKRKFHAKRTVYIPGVGVDTKKFNSGFIDIGAKRESLGVLSNDIMLLSVGELSERKNHEIVVRALKELNNLRIKYFIAGQGELQEYLSGLIKDYGLEDNVFLLGYRNDISELCQAADLFIFPSKQEGLPVALMEAIACKTPVYCSNIRGNVELVQNERTMFNPSDVGELSVCLRRFIGKKKRREFKEAWKKEVEANYKHLLMYDIQNVCSDMNGLYCNISGGGYDKLSNVLKRKDFATELNIDVGNTIILSVGELNRNKNHSTIIQAVARLGDSSVHYVVAGQGELKEELEELAEGLGIAKQLHLLGFRDDIADIMKVVDLYCLPSLREGLNVSLMEAIASGLPWIASDIRGNRDLFGKGRGYLITANKPEVWAQKIRDCIGNVEESATVKEGGEKGIGLFSQKEVLGRMQEIYMFYKKEI